MSFVYFELSCISQSTGALFFVNCSNHLSQHLSIEVGFCKMSPGVVSADALLAGDNVDV
jgi:hypothetical protein